ncbi:MAG: caspase family protein [Eubacteriales bacterium]|nr:caspase family protein [Eubacteriales bacterium]
MKHILAMLLLLSILPLPTFTDTPQGSMRALVIACDTFVSQDSMAPSASGNVEGIKNIFSSDLREDKHIEIQTNIAHNRDSLEEEIKKAFLNSTEKDTSILYISTHGEIDNFGGLDIIFSDGEEENAVKGKELLEIIEQIDGQKILFLDCCYSGNIISKGQMLYNPPELKNIKIITSAGGSELSYNWSSGITKKQITSHFMIALRQALSAYGGFAADINLDGNISLKELQSYLMEALPSSTAQFYPENDESSLLSYDLFLEQQKGIVSDMVFQNRVLQAGTSLDFSYTLNQKAHISYQFIYEKDGHWLFESPQMIDDFEDGSALLWPGRKHKTLTLEQFDRRLNGYVLFFIVAIDENSISPLAGTLLQVQESEPEAVKITTNKSLNPQNGGELCLHIAHRKPCTYTVSIRNLQGDVVARPFIKALSRPQRLNGGGSIIYWRGITRKGDILPHGSYSAQVDIEMGNVRLTAFSSAFDIL